jgi:hypothetical protein
MKIIKLHGDELPVTDEMRAQAFWLIQRYTSYTYIHRMYQVYSAFVTGYEGYARADPSDHGKWHRDNLAVLYGRQVPLERGLDLLKMGKKIGYAYVREGLKFIDVFNSPRFGDYVPMYLANDIGYRKYPTPSVGLYAWIERAMAIADGTGCVLEFNSALPRILQHGPFHFPPKLEPMPKPKGVRVRHKEEAPVSGIWLPVSFPNGCPGYLVAGKAAPAAARLAERLDYPAMEAGRWTPATPARSDYEYEPTPTDWELLWEDRRYQTGPIPDESAYLDETTEDPPYPPRYEPAKHLEAQ